VIWRSGDACSVRLRKNSLIVGGLLESKELFLRIFCNWRSAHSFNPTATRLPQIFQPLSPIQQAAETERPISVQSRRDHLSRRTPKQIQRRSQNFPMIPILKPGLWSSSRDNAAQDRESGAPSTDVILGDLWEMIEQHGSNDD
jgi:hypothetical protein